ncbi:hypothetical protein [Amycolatopsis magusensis]|uniref:Uncharacterized protein n=1 Tax=Amycolatopsis magusensis TaxID=882444 RepID=A0ABS4PTZ7_9PSEU|nr:hypothetical protein [Amycolatopsis magusensis]MBP2182905.1 hypothetical protein [Amycolatopsis magusensis]
MNTHTDASPPQPFCPDCEAGIGHAHREGCDVARCLVTGLQRLSHDAESCRCPRDTWTGLWPGATECAEFGWMLGPGLPDLHRLYTAATWNPALRRWTRPGHHTPTPEGITR